jgi:hypothetical protein
MAAVARGGVARAALACGFDQGSQRFFGSAAQFGAERQSDQLAPPPGRDVEVSIEPDQRAAFLRLGQHYALVVVDSERQVHEKVDPARLRIHIADVDRDPPFATEGWRGEVELLTALDRAGWLGRDKGRVVPFAEPLGCGEHAPDAVGRRGGDGRGTNVDHHAPLM